MTILERATRHAVPHLDEGLDAQHLEHGDEPLVIVRERRELGVEARKKIALNVAAGR